VRFVVLAQRPRGAFTGAMPGWMACFVGPKIGASLSVTDVL
jgi:hypothetical protein